MNIDKLKQYSIQKLIEQIDELQQLLEKHTELQPFYNLLMYNFENDIDKFQRNRSLDTVASEVLNTFVWSIWESIDVRTALQNPYHFDGGVIPNLNSFMVNVFLDDSAFSITRKDNYSKEWVVGPATDDNWYQNPDILVAAAYDVAQYWIDCEEEENGPCKLEVMKRGMKSSGKVETFLKG